MAQALIAFAIWAGSAIEGAIAATGVVTSIGVAAAVADVATAAVVVAEVAAISEVTKILQPKVGGNFGTQVDFKADPQAGIPYAAGRTGLGGNMVFRQSAGAHSSYLTEVTVYSLGPIDSYESFAINGTPIVFSADGGEGAAGYYQNRMWRVSQLGALPEASYLHFTSTATGDTPTNHAGNTSEWTSAHKLSGLAADSWCLEFNTDKYSAGQPQRLTVLKGVKVYDPRLDSTYPGGSGPQRANDESTWAYSDNAPLHALTWLIGRTQNGKRVMGCGIPLAAIDTPAFVTAANVNVANAWHCGGVVYSTDDKYEVFKAFLQAGGCKPLRLGAKISCMVSQPRTSLATITGADAVGKVSVAGGITRSARINTIWPQYREEAQNWSMTAPTAPITVASYVTTDGGQRSRQIAYPLVQNVTQAGQLARYDIENARELTPITIPAKPLWIGYQPGDCITANEPEWGLNSQKLIILKRSIDPATMQAQFICVTETDGKHAFALGQTAVAPSTPALTPFDPNNMPAPGAGVFAATGATLTGSGTSTIPAIVVTGTADTPYAAAILVQYRLHGAGTWTDLPAAPAGATRIEITGVVAGQQYDVQVAYRSVRGTPSAYTACAGGPFTAGVLTVNNRVTDNARPGAPVEGDINVIRDGSGLVIALETYHGGAWIQTSTNNKVTRSTTAPGSPTLNDIWIVLDGLGAAQSWKAWNGTAWVLIADITGNNTAAAISGQSVWATTSGLLGLTPTVVNGRTQYYNSSGQIFDYRGLLYGYSLGAVGARGSQPLSSTDTTISVAANTVTFPSFGAGASNEATISVPSHSFSSLTADTTYTVFWIPGTTSWACQDPGNTPPFYASLDGWLFIGAIRTAISGTSTYNPPPYGGGGVIGYCVDAEAWLSPELQARDAVPGDPLILMSPAGDAAFAGLIEAIVQAQAPRLRFRTACGAELVVSESAPIMTRTGPGAMPYAARAADCRPGMAVPLLVDGGVAWDLVTEILAAGSGPVSRISAGDGVFAASQTRGGVPIFTHNSYNKP